MSCDAYHELLPAYLDDTLDEVRRTGFRAHLKACAECREHMLAEEPTLALILGKRPQPSAERVEACVTAVMAGIRRERLERRLRPSRRPWLAAAAAVLVAVVAASWWWIGPGGGAEPSDPGAAIAVAESETAPVESAPPLIEPPRVEVDMTQEEVRVYRYAIGDDTSTGAVFIVNPSLEL
jgi:anti-sigma factor RsiW